MNFLTCWSRFRHLTLNPKLAQSIVDQIESDHIVVVCKEAEQQAIETLVKQIGWGKRVRGIITENNIIEWYTRCLQGIYSQELAGNLLQILELEFKREFPQAVELAQFIKERNYAQIDLPENW